MIGCYDFCGHYEWTFAWLEEQGGHDLVRDYWTDAIAQDSQRHARALISGQGIEGMKQYWTHTLAEEAAGYVNTVTDHIHNGLVQYRDYCDHCMGWIGPVMKEAGFVVDHEHNHQGQCWWEMRRVDDPAPPSEPGAFSGKSDVRLRPDWKNTSSLDVYSRATDSDDKSTQTPPSA
jgi:hypothetical protein